MTDFSSLKLTLPAVDLTQLTIAELLAINVDNLEETLQYQPTLYCTFGLLTREAERQAQVIKDRMEEIESEVRRDLHIRARIDSRRIVKDEIKQECLEVAEYLDCRTKYAALEHAANVLVTIEEAFKQRFGVLQQIAKRRSNELAQLGQAP